MSLHRKSVQHKTQPQPSDSKLSIKLRTTFRAYVVSYRFHLHH